MIDQELKRILRISTLVIRPWLFFIVIIVLAALYVFGLANSIGSHHDRPNAVFAMPIILFCWFAVGSSCLGMLVNAKSLCLPTTQIRNLALRTFALMAILTIAPVTLVSAFTNHYTWWSTAMLACVTAIMTLWILLPGWLGSPLAFMPAAIVITKPYWLNGLHLNYTDVNASWHWLGIAGLLYLIAWLRWSVIFRRAHLNSGFRGCMIENLGRTYLAVDGQKPISTYATMPLIFLPRFTKPEQLTTVDKMRTLLGGNFAPRRFAIYSFIGIVCIAIVVSAKYHLLTDNDASLAPFYIAILTVTIMPELFSRSLVLLLRHQNNDLVELALLPRLRDGSDKFYLARKAVIQPTLRFSLFYIITISIVALIFQPLPKILIITIVLSSAYAFTTQQIRLLHIFTHTSQHQPQSGEVRFAVLIWQLINMIAAGLITSIVTHLFGSNNYWYVTVTSTVLFAILTVLLSLGYRWYQQLKALPHPFVEHD